ncbi:helix-turn-helix domain-containing protein [Parabacteroides sp. OttesenSCG-928-B22]|nr:helix-turn-helix domain-containing protein [Parabacteroides sp. OttesenSCG-928-B22]
MKRHSVVLLSMLIGVCVLYAYGVGKIIQKEKQALQKTINHSFNLALLSDVELRTKGFVSHFRTGPTNQNSNEVLVIQNDTVSYHPKTKEMRELALNEKRFNGDQSYLYIINPIKVGVLDSLFQEQLKKEDVYSKTAVFYTDNLRQQIYTSRPDSVFYEKAYATKEITLGTNEEMTVQGFVQLSSFRILLSSPLFFLTTTMLIFLLGALGRRFLLFRKATKSNLSEKVKLPIIGRLFYNSSKREICDEQKSLVTLSPILGTLFEALLNDSDHFQAYEVLQEKCWGKVDKYSRNNLDQAIKRLVDRLKKIPQLKIKVCRGCGYQLIIEVEDSDK